MNEGRLFDEIARTLASPMPRRQALKRVVGGLAGAALASAFGSGRALADPTPKGGNCPPNHTFCVKFCCPPPKDCCVDVCCQPQEHCQDGKCVSNASPSKPGKGGDDR